MSLLRSDSIDSTVYGNDFVNSGGATTSEEGESSDTELPLSSDSTNGNTSAPHAPSSTGTPKIMFPKLLLTKDDDGNAISSSHHHNNSYSHSSHQMIGGHSMMIPKPPSKSESPRKRSRESKSANSLSTMNHTSN